MYYIKTDIGKVALIDLNGKEPGGTWDMHKNEYNRFRNVLDRITNDDPVMIELGCYWAVWSILFGKKFPNATLILNDMDKLKLNIGRANIILNDLECINYLGKVDRRGNFFSEMISDSNIAKVNLLHMDIQGAELGLSSYLLSKLEEKFIDNIIVATHSTKIHNTILERFSDIPGYEIISNIEYTGGKTGDGEVILSKI